MNGAPQAAGDLWYRLNSDSGSNYPYVTMYGTGSAPVAGQGTTSYGVLTYNDSTGRFSVVASFMDYSATDKHKTVLSRGGQANAFVMAYATRWANTNAVTTLQVGMNGTNYLSGSTFSLYGIKA